MDQMDTRLTTFIFGGSLIAHLMSYLTYTTNEEGAAGFVNDAGFVEDILWPCWMHVEGVIRRLWAMFSPNLASIMLAEFFTFCDENRPDIIVLDVIQEEISGMHGNVDLDEICSQVMDLACAGIHKYGARAVIIQAPIARSADIDCDYDTLVSRMEYINETMANLVQDRLNVYYDHLPSFESHGLPVDPEFFSEDLRVPGPNFHSLGFQSYVRDLADMIEGYAADIMEENEMEETEDDELDRW